MGILSRTGTTNVNQQEGLPVIVNNGSSSSLPKRKWSNWMPIFVVLVVILEIAFLGCLDMAKNAAMLDSLVDIFHKPLPSSGVDFFGGADDKGIEKTESGSVLNGETCEVWLEREDSAVFSRDFDKDPVMVSGAEKEWQTCTVGCKFGYDSDKKPDATFGMPHETGTATVLRSMESAQYYSENNIAQARRRGYQIVMTTSLSSDVPVGYFSWAEYDIMAPVQPKTESALAAAFISNCGARNFRLQALEGLEKENVKIDSYGGCHRNRDGRAVDKVETLKHYKFSLAFENSNEEDYVTEKFFQSLVAGKILSHLSLSLSLSIISMAVGSGCLVDAARTASCRDGAAAAHLKFISIFVIFFTSVVGISLPVLLARYFQGRPIYDKAILLIKCFAAGVILSTSLVHVLPDAFQALSDCQVASRHPWRDFPFSGLVTLVGALTALLVDVTASAHVENSHGHGHGHGHGQSSSSSSYLPVGTQEELSGKKGVELEKVEIVGDGQEIIITKKDEKSEELILKMKQRLVSQVLEIGIIFHSVIIGVTMGMSQNQCTIKPLVVALAFHQIFEGMGLGGCIAQAGFDFGTVAYMCFLFSVTTPMGIVLGMIVFSVTGYDDSSPNALIMEGLLGSLSSGILIYMGLVDLIAADFFHNKLMNSQTWLKKASFIALVLGSTSMSILAIWA